MKVVIIEDEYTALENLKYLLQDIDKDIEVIATFDTVSKSIAYFNGKVEAELAFFDIHLADGISFEIFEKTNINIPIIFTTAYDEYALKAFKVNSIDYILKPIDEEELEQAVNKYKSTQQLPVSNAQQFQQMVEMLTKQKKQYKSTYLVQQRDTLFPLNISDIAYFTINSGIVSAVTFEHKNYIIDEKLENIEVELNSDIFFRANRQFIVQRKAIQNLQLYFNGKLLLNVLPQPQEQIIVSKAKAPQLKKWMN